MLQKKINCIYFHDCNGKKDDQTVICFVIRKVKHDVYGRRQTAKTLKTTSDFHFFSSNP